MSYAGLSLPVRQNKPRNSGLTILIDNGAPMSFLEDTIKDAGQFIDFVKFGWGTSIVSNNISKKIACLRENNVEFFFGGTLFEKFLSQKKLDDYYLYLKKFGCNYVEISNGTIEIANRDKAKFINEFSSEFYVFSEVGSKDSDVSGSIDSVDWIEFILEDLEAGAKKVITEARESGTSGLCLGDGEMRFDIIDDIYRSGIDINQIIFEAPTKKMQTAFIKLAGPSVNLANIPLVDAIPLETLRLGLRSDTFYLFDREENK
ncbi:phosphosulfolactate synthase [Bacillus canaveralius]|uniref:phosphosulfolactate synthase n=1 Tax=Bacillus canaveralius TaxID=1403243 RepID=UPI000F76E0DE|nr:phosphosulfolactate synthase [Bacillus canaveralius]RSK52808.1 phosphosulfolactate synthase [Bacillus canaveralius]